MTRLAKTSASAARPYSSGVSRRAMTIATTARVSWKPDLRGADPDAGPREHAGAEVREPGERTVRHRCRLLGPVRRDEPVRSFRLRPRSRLYGAVHVRHHRRLQAGRTRRSGAPRTRPPRHDRRHGLPRARRRRLRVRRRRLDRRAPALDHRRRGRPPAVRQRARAHLGRPERRDLQPRRPARGAAVARPRAAQPLRHRGPPPPLRGPRAGAGRAPARHVRRRGLGPGRAPRRADPRPPGHQAALLRDRPGPRRLRLRAQGASSPAAS